MAETIHIRQMVAQDIETVNQVFTKHGIIKPKDYVSKCWDENVTGERVSLLAFYNDEFAGSLHLLEKSYYPPFVEQKIPEVNDFNVIEPLKRRGIGNRLMDAVEELAKDKYGIIGIGVGMHIYYGNAQRLYAKRGYIPDGRGVIYHNQQVMPDTPVNVDNDLVLYMTKEW